MIGGNETIGGTGPFTLTLNSGSTHYVGNGTITLNPTGVITQNPGSTLFYSNFVQAGGTVNGTLQNQGYFNYESGLFNGRLLNQGTLFFDTAFTAGNGVENDTAITLYSGHTLTVNGQGLDNLGSFTLSGGVISGNGPVVNDYGGIMQGNGTINPTLSNYGELAVSGVLRLNNSGTNANYGVVQGSGTLIGNFFNSSGGSVEILPGNLLAITSAWNNSGLVTLQGTNAVLGGGTITNNGTIQGSGTINSSITNSTGVIRASGGELT